MVGPSATGSLNGTPSSTTSAPASAAASTIFSLAASEGSPAVMYATRPSSPLRESSRNLVAIRPAACVSRDAVCCAASDIARKHIHILVAAAREIEDHDFVLAHSRRAANQLRERVRGFERGNDALDA